MLKKYNQLLSIIILLSVAYLTFQSQMPTYQKDSGKPETEFSVDRAAKHIQTISQKPHFVSSKAHEEVRLYIIDELKKLGLEVETQEGFVRSEWISLTKAKNILARRKGTQSGKALLLLTHYDSNPHSSLGASDAGSGVGVILEGLRAFLEQNPSQKNDLLILISDAEELGLNGAELFVNKHPWAKNIGLVLNFEARGSGGASYMLIETNGGNQNMIKAFADAKTPFPVSNSLVYSIYKMLPNDTDLTVFREQGNIDGFNFAFIDHHYDYHTVLDSFENLDKNTLAHQGSYLSSLLSYFSEADLSHLKSTQDDVYFNSPLGFFHYPFSWNLPLLIITSILFIALIFWGISHKKIEIKSVLKGFGIYLALLLSAGIIGFYGWQILLKIYPDYQEILHGFTYNGHYYIAAFSLLTLSISLWFYRSKSQSQIVSTSYAVAPFFIWFLINTLVVFKLAGASFFIIPVLFGLIGFGWLIKYEKPPLLALCLVTLPGLMILSPLVQMFPVGLGLKILFVSCVLLVLIFGLMLPFWLRFAHNLKLSRLLLLFSFGFLITAHLHAKFSAEHPKPNSLLYVLDADSGKALWVSYDQKPDAWNKVFLTEKPEEAEPVVKNLTVGNKYNTSFKLSAPAPVKSIALPTVVIEQDTVNPKGRHLTICITPRRKVNRLELFAGNDFKLISIRTNGQDYTLKNNAEGFTDWSNQQILSYYVVDKAPLEIEMVVPKGQRVNLTLLEASYDLFDNEWFTVPLRPEGMIPKPFVLNDAIVIKKSVSF